MSTKKEQFSEFSERTDRLAERLGVSLRELSAEIKISQAMLFAYRTGKRPISVKAWAKLEAAERKAGIIPQDGDALRVAEDPAWPVYGHPAPRVEPHLARSRESLFNLRRRMPAPTDLQDYLDTVIHGRDYCNEEGPYLLYLWDELFRIAKDLEKMRNRE